MGRWAGALALRANVPLIAKWRDVWGTQIRGGRNPGLKSETRDTHFPARFQRLGLGCRLALA